MYVSVAFTENGKTYDYNVPDYLTDKMMKLRPNYVIVEDVYADYVRYKVVRVMGIRYSESFKATKNIVDIVDSRGYIKEKELKEQKSNLINDIVDILEKTEVEHLVGLKNLFETCLVEEKF